MKKLQKDMLIGIFLFIGFILFTGLLVFLCYTFNFLIVILAIASTLLIIVSLIKGLINEFKENWAIRGFLTEEEFKIWSNPYALRTREFDEVDRKVREFLKER